MLYRPPFLFPLAPRGIISPVRGQVIGGGVQASGSMQLSFVTSGVVTSGATIAIPATAQAGDLAVLLDGARNGASVIPTKVIPTNWTEVADVSGSGATVTRMRGDISYKVLAAGEPGTNVTGMNDTAESKIMLIFRPAVSIASVTPSTATGEVAEGNPVLQTIAMASAPAGRPVIGIAHWYSANAIDPRTSTPAMAEVTNGTTSFGQYVIYNTAPADHTIDMDDEGTGNLLQGVYLSIA